MRGFCGFSLEVLAGSCEIPECHSPVYPVPGITAGMKSPANPALKHTQGQLRKQTLTEEVLHETHGKTNPPGAGGCETTLLVTTNSFRGSSHCKPLEQEGPELCPGCRELPGHCNGVCNWKCNFCAAGSSTGSTGGESTQHRNHRNPQSTEITETHKAPKSQKPTKLRAH